MRRALPWLIAAGGAAVLTACATGSSPPANPMSYFITSANPGKGGDLGGLAGADQHCQKLATAAGAGGKTWRAYLSAPGTGGSPAVNARDRIGKGPWTNARGVVVARNVDELHGNNNINRETALDEKGVRIRMRPDTPNQHDILTGSNADGTLSTQAADTTCRGWTSGTEGSAIVGHVDRTGTNPDPVRNVSWNSSHGTPGCSPEALARVGGGGLFYCFAAN
ncbi:hypothetical protein JI739_09750 [Ramlibacter sp. AW1]|uniref:Lectin n=1 Tax=Ramlibacter aurantiacus TaxID=2801330 RepID=A0A936ZQG2_9BURK|nr:hypothetical protein [Ramlibacter aurantiacus]MBL0420626.1 hypothetical protein [Ramlibacter aurantiacus]